MAELAKFIPWIPLLAAVVCGICGMRRDWRGYAGPVAVAGVVLSFFLTLTVYPAIGSSGAENVVLMRWIEVGTMSAHFGYFLDPLTMVMLLVVTGIGSLIVIYAMGYMQDDPGYARFFMAVGIFIFAMTTVAMADNLILLFLGWEVVGLASYMLIGYYYRKPSAVAAAKKAFIVNRIGDVGFALGIFAAYKAFGTVHIPTIIEASQGLLGSLEVSAMTEASVAAYELAQGAQNYLIAAPFLLMLGAFGKSAQFPLLVWLPDAMEGPSPVSALIHAATMVTSGIYMIARLLPLFALSSWALPTVAIVGGITALYGALVATRQDDLKKIFAYSTVSQLGYMFMGVAALATFAGVFHLITHAFFKALLFLTAGNVMHALHGQLDINKMSGLGKKMPVTKWLMLAGCLALAGFPLTAGFFSKDMIIGYTFEQAVGGEGSTLFFILGFMALGTAALTAYYAFRAWFRVFTGPEHYEMGHDHMVIPESELVPSDPEHSTHHGDEHAHGHHGPHEMKWWPMNAPLLILAVGAIFGGSMRFVGGDSDIHYGWIGSMVHGSTADPYKAVPDHGPLHDLKHDAHGDDHGASQGAGHDASHGEVHGEIHTDDHALGEHADTVIHSAGQTAVQGAEHAAEHAAHAKVSLLGITDLHTELLFVSGIIALLSISVSWYFHSYNRAAATKCKAAFGGAGRALADKLYLDEIFHTVVVYPLRTLGHLFYVADSIIINSVLALIARIPIAMGLGLRPGQSGRLHGYGLGMVICLATIAAVLAIYVLVL